MPLADAEADVAKYDEEEGDTGGFGATAGKVQVMQQINHAGEVNRARVCPQNKFLIATKTVCRYCQLYWSVRRAFDKFHALLGTSWSQCIPPPAHRSTTCRVKAVDPHQCNSLFDWQGVSADWYVDCFTHNDRFI